MIVNTHSDISKWLTAVATTLSVVAAGLSTVDVLGSHRGVSTILIVGLATLLITTVAVWLAGRRALDTYRHSFKQREATVIEKERRQAFLTTEVLPAFQDVGVDRTRRYFVNLVTDLQLDDTRRKTEFDFIEEVVARPSINKREKIDQLVRHFNAIALEAGLRDAQASASDQSPADAGLWSDDAPTRNRTT